MSDALLVAFVLSFAGGPLIGALLLRLGRPFLVPLVLGTVATALAALILQAREAVTLSLVLLWLAWVLAVSLVTLAVRQRAEAAATKRLATIIGLLATTLPWFGLATAQMMAS